MEEPNEETIKLGLLIYELGNIFSIGFVLLAMTQTQWSLPYKIFLSLAFLCFLFKVLIAILGYAGNKNES